MKSKSNSLNAVQKEALYYKRKMIIRRIIGIIACLVTLGCIAIYYFKTINEWLCIIIIAYCLGTIFSTNSFLQDIKVGNPWQRINGVVAVGFYIIVVFLIVYGFITKSLQLQF